VTMCLCDEMVGFLEYAACVTSLAIDVWISCEMVDFLEYAACNDVCGFRVMRLLIS